MTERSAEMANPSATRIHGWSHGSCNNLLYWASVYWHRHIKPGTSAGFNPITYTAFSSSFMRSFIPFDGNNRSSQLSRIGRLQRPPLCERSKTYRHMRFDPKRIDSRVHTFSVCQRSSLHTRTIRSYALNVERENQPFARSSQLPFIGG